MTAPVLLAVLALGADEPRVLRAGTDAEVAKALAAAGPGDTVLIADGTYIEPLLIKRSGAAGQPITVKAEHRRKALFDRKGQSARVEGSHFRVEGLVFDSRYGDCTAVRAAGKDIHFLDCEIRRPGSADGKAGGTACSSSTRPTASSRSATSTTASPPAAGSASIRTAFASPTAAT